MKKNNIYLEYKQQDFNISFHNQSFSDTLSNKSISTKFKIIFQTTSKTIENYCMTNYPTLLTHKQYSADEIRQFIEMRNYISRSLTNADKDYVHKYFFDRGWLEPFKFNRSKFTSIVFDDYDAKMWADTSAPYLEIDGTITLDINKMLNEYISSRFIKYETPRSQKITSKEILIRFDKNFPLIITYRGGLTFKNILLKMVTDIIKSNRKSIIKDEVEKQLKLDKIHEYKMDITWNQDNSIKVLINDSIKLLKLKAKKNIVPLTLGYFMLRNK
jgi:hypothetical protein